MVILPANCLHALYNRSSEPGLVLGISTPLHQTFFDAVAKADRKEAFSTLPFATAMARVAEIGLQHSMYFPPYDVKTAAK